MRIKRMVGLSRYEFEYDSECEFCGHIVENRHGGYGDYFATNILPNFVCPQCGKSSMHEEDEGHKTIVHGGSDEKSE